MHDVWDTRVRFAETDAQGIVFYGEYVTYQDETLNQFMRNIGYPWSEIESTDWDIHVVHTELDYRAPAEFGDDLVCGIRVAAVRESSIEFAWNCRQADGTLCAEGEMTHVAVQDGEPTRVPQGFRDAVVAYQDDPPEPV
ncbi:acyl-CoA thioesterase [Halorarius halobius]|uniref:acyl-CoA thioesterase n=1 Tax=Halorarius halobius TaxID=2962671 RepID=UPI0020CF00C4|nr:thioesterase family protein [Halorarius halobius]